MIRFELRNHSKQQRKFGINRPTLYRIDGLKETDCLHRKGLDQVADTLQLKNVKAKDNYDVTTNIMIGSSEDGSAGLSKELKERI